MASIAVITATLNASAQISRLADDLASQSDSNFRWIVVDGGSTDGTLASLPESLRDRTDATCERDFGIYDALNKGVRRCAADYYLVVGADDRLAPDAISCFRHLADSTGADIIAASVREGDRVVEPGRGKPWLRGQNAYLSHHSAGTLIRRDLHARYGFYSHAFPIAADQLFVKRVANGGATFHYAPQVIAGEFSRGGVSSVQFSPCLFEFTLVQLRTEKYRSFQLLLFIGRLLRHWARVIQ
jgi:glycosyltransferase involved in cell wall biosynthesis